MPRGCQVPVTDISVKKPVLVLISHAPEGSVAAHTRGQPLGFFEPLPSFLVGRDGVVIV